MRGIVGTEFELSHHPAGAGSVPVRPDGGSYAAARVLVRLHGVPLGFVEQAVLGGRLDLDLLIKTVDVELLDAVNEHLAADGRGAVASAGELPGTEPGCPTLGRSDEKVTVIVATRNRPTELERCLGRLQHLIHPRLEVLIVDNGSTDDRSEQAFYRVVGTDPRFRYVREPTPGKSNACNRGLREATGTLVAFTDDDVSVDPGWVRALAQVFADPAVACVTGLISTAAIDGPAERYFDARVSWADSCRPRTYALGSAADHGLFPYSPGTFGAGANFAARTSVLRRLGGLDLSLGPGTRAGGGEDLDLFVRIILAGHSLVYQPSALVWHHHRSDLAGLRAQMFTYGSGLSAYLTKHVLDPATRREVLKRVPRGVGRLAAIATRTRHSTNTSSGATAVPVASGVEAPVPARALLLRELAGFAFGPVLYGLARRTASSAAR